MNKGLIVILATLLVLSAGLIIVLSASYISLNNIKVVRSNVYSAKAYYIAEAGIEDSLLRLNQGMKFSKTNSLTTDNLTATINISDPIGGSRTITSSGNAYNRIRKIRVVHTINADSISFHYGAQVGDGGMEMGNNARVKGNVFSNGNVIGLNNGYIDNSVIVAHNGNKIQGLVVGQDALVHTCESSTINGNLTYVSGGSLISCTVKGATQIQPNEIEPQSLPIPDSQINEWKSEAVSGGIFYDNVLLTNGAANSLGPIQIGTPVAPKNLTVTNGANLQITGTIYVTGNIDFSNNAIIELDNAYGSLSGMIIADGKISTGNNAILRGSGETGSYILILSTNTSLNPASPAILVSNNAAGTIFYANSGLIYLGNNMKAREVTGYKIKINNNAEIQYESGLENALFSSGPGGSWQVTEWKEVE